MTNVFWLTFAPITSIAEKFYSVSPLQIAFLSMSYMIVYIVMTAPASWLVDTKGFRLSMGVGAVATAVFGMTRGIFADSFAIVTITQLGAAIGQPFLTNSMTKVAARWFPVNERATATGIASMAGCLGMIAAMVLTPTLTSLYGFKPMLMLYGYASVVCALIFLLLSKERPLTPPGSAEELTNKLNMKDVVNVLKKKDFQYLTICFFIILGAFNAIMTWIEDVLRPKGMSPDQSGLIGGMIVIFGLIGAVLLPTLSDKIKRRQPFLAWSIFAAMLGFIGLTFSSNYVTLLISTCLLGFFILGMGPIGFQYGAEIAYPVPEGTSYGILMMMGQISGILFIYFMDVFRSRASGTMTLSLIILTFMILIAF
jgi:MFS family permease